MLDLEHFLPYRLSVLANQTSAGIHETYGERFGISVTEWRVIAILGRFPGIAATEVAQRSAMDKVAVSRAVHRLIEQDRVARRSNADDRRAKHLYLSEQGRAVFDAIAPAALAYEKQLLKVLDDSEREQLNGLLDRLIQASRA